MSGFLHSHPIFARKWNPEPEMEMANLKKSLKKCTNKFINYQNIHMVPIDFGIGEWKNRVSMFMVLKKGNNKAIGKKW